MGSVGENGSNESYCKIFIFINKLKVNVIVIFNVASKEELPDYMKEMLELTYVEIVEIIYMILFFMIGTPVNAYAFLTSLK